MSNERGIILTEQQRRFVEHYARTANAAEAARAAGYSERSARSIGNRLLTKDDIKRAIEDLNSTARRERVADAEEIQGFWTNIMRDPHEKTADRLTASVSLAKSAGMFSKPIVVTPEPEEKSHVVIYLPEIEKDDEDE